MKTYAPPNLTYAFFTLFLTFTRYTSSYPYPSSPQSVLSLVCWCRQAMIDEFDLDQDGEINEAEFLAIMMDGE